MRAMLVALTIAAAAGLAGTSGAVAAAANASMVSDAIKGVTILEQRCSCVERRWNGSCKLRVCRDHW